MTVRRPRGQGGSQPSPAPDLSRLRQGAAHPDVAAFLKASGPRKYRNVPTVIGEYRFDSKKEAQRYIDLMADLVEGKIRDLEVHPRFPLVVRGEDCGVYVGDFAWIDPETGERVIEDVKSAATRKLPVYRLKRRLVWALYGINIREV